jgi:hypothetical protein
LKLPTGGGYDKHGKIGEIHRMWCKLNVATLIVTGDPGG